MPKILTVLFWFCFWSFSHAQAYLPTVDTLRSLQIDQQLIDVELFFSPKKGEVSGVLQLVFETTENTKDSIWLDGPFIDFTKVEYVGAQMESYKVYSKGLSVKLKSPALPGNLHKLKIEYTAQPRKGMYFVGWDSSIGQIWTQGQGIDNRYWLPMVDDQNDKVLWSVTTTLPTEYTFVSNGRLSSSDTAESAEAKMTRWRYTTEKPMSPYLIAIAIGEYTHQKHVSNSGIPLKNYLYPKDSAYFPITYKLSTELFNWMEELLIPFPWSKYDQLPVREFQHGAMENTTATLFGDFYVLGERAAYDAPYLEINAHELAHQWFGNLQTSTNATHHWLHEGFATFLQWEAVKEFVGEEAYFDRLEKARVNIYEAGKVDSYPLCHPLAGSARFYQKGGWVLTMLKEKVGEETFYKGLRNYLRLDSSKNKTTRDFIEVMEEVYGEDLTGFFALWVFDDQIPRVFFEVEKKERRNYQFSLVATHIPPNLTLEVPIEIWNGSSVEVAKVLVENGDSLTWEVDHSVTYALVFPRKRTLCEIEEDKSTVLWENQLKNAHSLDAEWALQALVATEGEEALKWAYYTVNGTAPARLQRVAAQVIGANYPYATLHPWFAYLHPTARTAFAETLDSVLPVDYEFFAPYLLDSTEEGVTQWASLLGDIRPKEVYQVTSDIKPGAHGDLFFIRSLMIIDPRNPTLELNKWVALTSPEVGFNLRLSAFGALVQLNYLPDEVVDNLVIASASGNRRLRNAARKYLVNNVEKERAQKHIISYFEARPQEPKWKRNWFDKNFPESLSKE